MADGNCSIPGCTKQAFCRTWCPMHYQRWRKNGDPLDPGSRVIGDIEARFWTYVDKDGPLPQHRPDLGPCWEWRGARDRGYGVWWANGTKHVASRWAYSHFVSPVSNDLQVDHLCFNPPCVNFEAHLEPVLPVENNRRSTSPSASNARRSHCVHGHEFTEANTYVDARGGRHCRMCRAARAADRRRRLSA